MPHSTNRVDARSNIQFPATATQSQDKHLVETALRRASNTQRVAQTSSVATAFAGDENRSSKRLLDVMVNYHHGHPGRLAKDLSRSPVLNRYLILLDSTPAFKEEHLTPSEFKELLSALKKTGHGFGSHLPGKLKEAWRAAKLDRSLLKVGHDQALDRSTLRHDLTRSLAEEAFAAGTHASAVTPQITPHGFNPFTSDETSVSDLDPSNPFAGEDDAVEVTSMSSMLRLVDTPNHSVLAGRKIEEYPESRNPFAEDTGASSATVILPLMSESDVSNEIATVNPQGGLPRTAEFNLAYGPPAIFLQLLNQYLRTEDGKSFGDINKSHVKKIRQDIKDQPLIARYITLVGEKGQERLEWKGELASKDDLQNLLFAFKKRHSGGGSFYKVLVNFSFPEAGYRLIDDAALEKIVHNAAKPAMHRPGKSIEVGMKRRAMTDALEHFREPLRHEQPLPNEVLAPLIAHYGRVAPDQDRAQQAAEKLANKNKLSLNDDGFGDALKRLFRRIKTDERVERFERDVNGVANKFQEAMVEDLNRIRDQHAPEGVTQRTKMRLDRHLNRAYMAYAKSMPGINIYPEHLSDASVVAKQIHSQAQKNYRAVLMGVVTSYEKEFMDSLGSGISSFSAVDYFQGKSREKAVDNIIKINDSLSSLHQVAQIQHNTNMRILVDDFNSPEAEGELADTFQGQQHALADGIKKIVVNNYQAVLGLYDQDLSKLKSANSGSFSEQLKNTKALSRISGELVADVKKLYSHRLPDFLEVERDFLNAEVQKSTKPLLEKMRSYLPEARSIGQTLTSAFARAFKPTPARILGGIPLLGGLVFSLAALPTTIAVPLGITAAVVLPVALLGWVGWNIYKRFAQRSEIQQLSTQMEKQWCDIDANNI